jgi:hypothetical protein
MKSTGPLCLVVALCACGGPKLRSLEGCDQDSDCPMGNICQGGECVQVKVAPPPRTNDAGLPECAEGDTAACGASKLGECHLGTSRCLNLDGQWKYGPCEGAVGPGPEVCDGKDNDCDGMIDEGLPALTCGVGACARTGSSCMSCTPGAPQPETCNGVDDDCDGVADDHIAPVSCGVGACARMVPACTACVPGMPQAETCNGVDDDCNGIVDDALGSISCGTGACARTVEACVGGVAQTCTPGAPAAEVCNGVDDDCNGMVDEGIGALSCGLGACARSVPGCMNGAPGTCTPGAPAAETCNGIDDDCNGAVDNGVCGPGAVCPGGQTVSPNTTVTLSTMATPSAGRTATCQWSVVSRPATSNGGFSAPTSCAATTYFADVVGTHTLRFTVTDSAGVSASCAVSIVVNPLGDLWIELTWDHNDDMDLHLQHPSAGNSHNANGWDDATYDCYWANTNPGWDAPGTADDPSLDRDDILAKGPENTRINAPSTAHAYTIGVHMYSYAASPKTVTATVKVYCGGTLVTTRQRGFTTVDDMWVVGKVQFAPGSSSCTFTYDGYVFTLP